MSLMLLSEDMNASAESAQEWFLEKGGGMGQERVSCPAIDQWIDGVAAEERKTSDIAYHQRMAVLHPSQAEFHAQRVKDLQAGIAWEDSELCQRMRKTNRKKG